MKKTLIALLALGGVAAGSTQTFTDTYLSAKVSITLNVDEFRNIAGSNIDTSAGEVLDLFVLNGSWSNENYTTMSSGTMGIANNGKNQNQSTFWGSWTKGDKGPNRSTKLGMAEDLFSASTDWDNVDSITLNYVYDSTLTSNVTANKDASGDIPKATQLTNGTQVQMEATITYKDGSDPTVKTSSATPYFFTTWEVDDETNTWKMVDNEYKFLATSIEVNDTYVSSFTVTGLKCVPEPTTATLSLLALAGLAARRRRK